MKKMLAALIGLFLLFCVTPISSRPQIINAPDFSYALPIDNGVSDWPTSPEDIDGYGNNWWAEAIGLQAAMQYADLYAPIKIGIVDNGFEVTHPDLMGKITIVSEFNNYGKHGTHIAGIIGALKNDIGMTGIVQNAQLICYDYDSGRTSTGRYQSDADILDGVEAVVKAGAKVVNISVANNDSTIPQEVLDENAYFASKRLDEMLYKYGDFVVVQSAGNNAQDTKYAQLFASVTKSNCINDGYNSADYIMDRIIIVGSAQRGKKVNTYIQAASDGGGYAGGSNDGSQVSICAPGKSIYSTVLNGEYDYMSGTSMAAPMVTGIAGLVWSINPNLTGAQVKKIVCGSTVDTVESNLVLRNYYTFGPYALLNALAAVESAFDTLYNTPSP